MENVFDLRSRCEDFGSVIQDTVCTKVDGQDENTEKQLIYLTNIFQKNHKEGGTIYVIGNGGSSAVASHAITDFVNACQLRALTIHESALLSCMANDYGYETAYKNILKSVFKSNDILIAISSSGQSPNMLQAVEMAKSMNGFVITLTGFKSDNPLRKKGHINFWLNSNDYGLIEIGHLFILHNISDRIGSEIKKEKKMDHSVSELLE